MAHSGYSGVDPHNKDMGRYDKLKDLFKKGPVTVKEIRQKLGISDGLAATMINNLSRELPIWEPDRGIYKILEDSDFEKYRMELKK